MGVLNVTPDSFSDGGKFLNTDVAVNRALQMVEEGADIIDVGGESTRPGATPVSVQAESDRVLPVLEAVRSCSEVALSCDTSKPEIMQASAWVQAAAHQHPRRPDRPEEPTQTYIPTHECLYL